MRPNRRVRVKFDAPGNLIPLRRATGTIIRVDNRIATVRHDLGGDARPIYATFLELWNDGVTPTPQDSPDLAAYKLKVARVAQRLGRQHNLCDVLDNALREIDIEPLRPRRGDVNRPFVPLRAARRHRQKNRGPSDPEDQAVPSAGRRRTNFCSRSPTRTSEIARPSSDPTR